MVYRCVMVILFQTGLNHGLMFTSTWDSGPCEARRVPSSLHAPIGLMAMLSDDASRHLHARWAMSHLPFTGASPPDNHGPTGWNKRPRLLTYTVAATGCGRAFNTVSELSRMSPAACSHSSARSGLSISLVEVPIQCRPRTMVQG